LISGFVPRYSRDSSLSNGPVAIVLAVMPKRAAFVGQDPHERRDTAAAGIGGRQRVFLMRRLEGDRPDVEQTSPAALLHGRQDAAGALLR
jgi:hypothetical protein